MSDYGKSFNEIVKKAKSLSDISDEELKQSYLYHLEHSYDIRGNHLTLAEMARHEIKSRETQKDVRIGWLVSSFGAALAGGIVGKILEKLFSCLFLLLIIFSGNVFAKEYYELKFEECSITSFDQELKKIDHKKGSFINLKCEIDDYIGKCNDDNYTSHVPITIKNKIMIDSQDGNIKIIMDLKKNRFGMVSSFNLLFAGGEMFTKTCVGEVVKQTPLQYWKGGKTKN